MLGASLLPARFRLGYSQNGVEPPSWLNKYISPVLQSLTSKSCNHPIYTIVTILVLASSSYVGFLEGGLADPRTSNGVSGSIDFTALVDGSRQLKLGKETGWKWQQDTRVQDTIDSVSLNTKHVAIYLQSSLRITMRSSHWSFRILFR